MIREENRFYDPILADLVPAYIDTQRKNISQLADALHTEDFDCVRDIAHRIKGSAACYGFKPYGDLAARLEEVSKERQMSECRRLFALMREEFPQGF